MWKALTLQNPPTMPLKFVRSFIRSMIFNIATVGGFGGGPPPVCLACLRASVKDFFGPLLSFSPLKSNLFN